MDLSKTILGLPYREDDRVLLIAYFVAEHMTSPAVEIEAKLGYFRFPDQLSFPHIMETDLNHNKGRFESSLQPLMFYSLLEQLKSICKDFTYQETEDSLYSSSDRNSKIRQTIGKNHEILSIIKKTKLADKNFVLNSSGAGIRISANLEVTLPEIPEDARFSVMRKKKRHAFRYQYLEVDMTEVSMNNKMSYELEIEIIDYNFVKSHVDNYICGSDKGGLVGISRKIWQNALALSYHKPKALVVRVEERRDLAQEREENYRKHVGGIMPVIGDYLFCIAKEQENGEMVV